MLEISSTKGVWPTGRNHTFHDVLSFTVKSVERGLLELSFASLYPKVSAKWQAMQDLKNVVMVHLQNNEYLLERTLINRKRLPSILV